MALRTPTRDSTDGYDPQNQDPLNQPAYNPTNPAGNDVAAGDSSDPRGEGDDSLDEGQDSANTGSLNDLRSAETGDTDRSGLYNPHDKTSNSDSPGDLNDAEANSGNFGFNPAGKNNRGGFGKF